MAKIEAGVLTVAVAAAIVPPIYKLAKSRTPDTLLAVAEKFRADGMSDISLWKHLMDTREITDLTVIHRRLRIRHDSLKGRKNKLVHSLGLRVDSEHTRYIEDCSEFANTARSISEIARERTATTHQASDGFDGETDRSPGFNHSPGPQDDISWPIVVAPSSSDGREPGSSAVSVQTDITSASYVTASDVRMLEITDADASRKREIVDNLFSPVVPGDSGDPRSHSASETVSSHPDGVPGDHVQVLIDAATGIVMEYKAAVHSFEQVVDQVDPQVTKSTEVSGGASKGTAVV